MLPRRRSFVTISILSIQSPHTVLVLILTKTVTLGQHIIEKIIQLIKLLLRYSDKNRFILGMGLINHIKALPLIGRFGF